MKVNSENLPGSMVTLTIETDEAEYQQSLEQAYRQIAGRVNIPGFRRGKAPRAVVVRTVGQDALEEEAQRISLPKFYTQAVKEAQIQPITDPEVEVTQQRPLIVKVTVPVRPEIQLGKYQDLRLTREEPVIAEPQVDAELAQLRERLAEWPEVERAAGKGDFVTLAAEGYAGHRPILYSPTGEELAHAEKGETVIDNPNWLYPVEPERGYPLPGFAEQIIGMEIGAEKDFRLVVPGDNPDFEKSKFAGQELSFHVKLQKVQEKRLPELDDAFASRISGRDTVEGLREDMREMLLARAKAEEEERLSGLVVDMAAAQVQVEMPEILIENQTQISLERLESSLQQRSLTMEAYLRIAQQSEDDLKRDMRTRAEREVKNTFVVEAIADAVGIAVSPEEIEAEVSRMGMMMRDAARARREFADPDRRERIEGSLRRNKAIQWLVQNATQDDKPVEANSNELVEAVPAVAETAQEEAKTEMQPTGDMNQA